MTAASPEPLTFDPYDYGFEGFTPRRVTEMTDRIRELTLQHLEPALEQVQVR